MIGPIRADLVRHRPSVPRVGRRGGRIGNGHPPPVVGRAAVVNRVLVRLIRRRRGEIRGVQPQDVEDIGIVDLPAGIDHRVGDPLRLAITLGLIKVGLAAARIGHDEPDQTGPDDEPDDQQPPVELGVHLARVQGSAVRTRQAHRKPQAVRQLTRDSATALCPYTRRMIDITPDPVFVRILGFPIMWYGICYAVGLAAVYWVLIREARYRGLDEDLVGNGMIIVAVAALIGGRLYHVIDQWQLYKDHWITAILPLTVQADGSYAFAGFSGLGVPGGIIVGTITAWIYLRRLRQPFWQWADVVAPGLFVMQAIGRWGNFFNQELYGPPTTLPWGIQIDKAHRVGDYVDLTRFPLATTHFHPLFLYESISGLVGALVLVWLARRPRSRLVAGDLLLIFFVWYGLTRFALEGLRTGNWTFFGIPTAQIVTAVFIFGGIAGLIYRHGPGRPAALAVDLLADRPVKPAADDEDAFWADDDDESDDDESADESDDDEAPGSDGQTDVRAAPPG